MIKTFHFCCFTLPKNHGICKNKFTLKEFLQYKYNVTKLSQFSDFLLVDFAFVDKSSLQLPLGRVEKGTPGENPHRIFKDL